MAWFRKERKKRPSRNKLEIPVDAWDKCTRCGHVDLRERFQKSLEVCPECDFHRRITAADYVKVFIDEGTFEETDADLRSVNPLSFDGYADRLARAHRKNNGGEAVLTGHGELKGLEVNLGVMEFDFMGGSMGSVVGEKIARLGQRSVKDGAPLILVSRSGGARMQEGVLSLMQLAKTSVVISQLARERVPYISVLTNPTTGGVSASFGMQGDVHIAEPEAVIGYAGPRVIKQTIGQDLPEGFQTAEFLVEHGMIDLVVARADLQDITGRLLRMMLGR